MAVTALATGCGRSTEQRINDAIALSPEAAQARSVALERVPVAQREAFEAEVAKRLDARAQSCGGRYRPSWTDSANDIRKALVDLACFQRADQELADWLQWRAVGFVLAQPPLRPMPPAPPQAVRAEGSIERVHLARQAGVIMLAQEKLLQFVALDNGQTLHRQPLTPSAHGGDLSPNGRLFVWHPNRELTQLRAVEGGAVVATLPAGVASFRWLDSRFGLHQGGPQLEPHLLDFATGVATAAPDTGIEVEETMPIAGHPGEFLLASHRQFTRIKVNADARQSTVEMLNQVNNTGSGIHPRSSGLSADGRFHFQAVRGLTVISPVTLQQETVFFDPLQVPLAVALDADQVLLRTAARRAQGSRSFVYRISDKSLAEVADPLAADGWGFHVPAWRRLAAVQGATISFPALATPGAREPLSTFVTRMLDEATAKAEAAAAAEAAASAPSALLSRPTAPDGGAPLARLAANSQMEVVGVYAADESGNAQNENAGGSIEVRVRKTAAPLLLVLSSHDSVRWTLQLDAGARLAAVLLFSRRPSSVLGAGDTEVLAVGQEYAFERGSVEFMNLNAEVLRLTGKPIGTFHGQGRASSFTVGMQRLF